MKIHQNIKVAVDAVVFGYSDNKLKILLIQQKFGSTTNKWALPGGFVKDAETLEQAVIRELNEETGVKANYLEQLYTFGAINRDERARVIAVSYIALINPKNYSLKADTDAIDAKWFDINDIPKLAFDHKDIITKGLERLKAKINYQPIGFELLNSKFPFSDLENLYQTILSKKIDRRNFRKKLLSFEILQETTEFQNIGSGRPAKLYKFNNKKYRELEQNGFHFEIKFA
ncbi:MAG TPA: NUDIX hydrolase [Crocinitomix sp.]|nr:NUDIX hydrolase [Bacteroidia bacterium]HIP35340.1 NUDIX hydrolase [Crocinitomix sp.]